MSIPRRRKVRRARGTLLGVTFERYDCGEMRNRLRSFNRLLGSLGAEKFDLVNGHYTNQKEVARAKERIAGINRMIAMASSGRLRIMDALLKKCNVRV